MSGDSDLTEGRFDELLRWLDPDREPAARKYETIRLNLVRRFARRGCGAEAEALADETINRVARRVPGIRATYVGDPEKFFFGVARLVWLEHRRRTEKQSPLPNNLPAGAAPDAPDDAPDDVTHDCMRSCVQNLPDDQRELLRQYYQEAPSPLERQKLRTDLAGRLGVSLTTLRVRVFRIVEHLRACVEKCKRARGM